MTCEPNAVLREIGCFSMPVILPPGEAQAAWLRGEWKRAQALLTPYSSSLMRENAV